MILLAAILTGWLAGIIVARLRKQTWTIPEVRLPWLVVLGFLPQLLAFYLPATRDRMPDAWAAACLIVSDVVLLAFCLFNHRLAGMWLLAVGTMLNLLVITANGGFMPISPKIANQLIEPNLMVALTVGERFGAGKDILLLPMDTRLAWLSDTLLMPAWFPNRFAFSPGDTLISCGAFWLMATQGRSPFKHLLKRGTHAYSKPYTKESTHPANGK